MRLKALLGKVGVVKGAAILTGLPDGLNARGLEAASKLQFTPARNAAGEPIDSWVTVAIKVAIRR